MKIYRVNKCFSDQELASFLEKKSSSERYDEYITHFAGCPECLEKALDVQQLMGLEESSVSPELIHRARIDVDKSVEKNSSVKQRSGIINLLRPVALAASIVLLVLVGLYTISTLKDGPEQVKNILSENSSRSIDKLHATGTVTSQRIKVKRHYVHKDRPPVIHSRMERKKKMLHAGYLYFALRNSKNTNRRLIIQLSANLSGTKLDLNEMISLLKHKRFQTFQKRISSLPKKYRSEFSKGYIQSHLTFLDKNGNLDSELIKKGKRMVLKSSTNEIQECMLYQKHLLYLY